MKILDMNMILRYLLRDDEQKALLVADILLNSQVYVPIEVFAEVVFVLNGKIYNRSRTKIKDCLIIFLDLINCENKDVVKVALETFAENNLDFVDCVLFAYHKVLGYEICTFDKKLNRLIEKS